MENNLLLCESQAWGLFIVRVILGLTFTLHGGQKVLGVFGGPGLEGFVQWGSSLGIPYVISYVAAFAEFIGGLLLILGFASEIGAILTGSVMIGAIFLVHGVSKYFVQDNGFEYPFVLLILLFAIIIGGPGKGALWDLGQKWRKNTLEKILK